MEEVIYYNELYDLYGSLLTVKQKNYFEDYYFHNLSYSEIGENNGVSRNAAFRQVHIVTEKLIDYEKKLKLFEKKNIVLHLSKIIDDPSIKKELENLF